MILVREYFQSMTELPIGDPAVSPSASTAIFLDSREAVDPAVAAGVAAGGSEPASRRTSASCTSAGSPTPTATSSTSAGWTRSPPSRARRPSRTSRPEAGWPPATTGSTAAITRALELVGERWALLIVRDLLVGPRRYSELAAGLPRIPSNVLAARLKELQAAGVLRRVPHSRVIVYELTPYGRELEPVVLALGAWGFKALGDPREEQVITPDSMTMDLRTAFRPTSRPTCPRPRTPRTSVPPSCSSASTGPRST